MVQNIKHIALIPDGNRRWARAKGYTSIEGHRYAVEHTLPALYDEMLALQIPYCTFWALSPENFLKRSTFEIQHLFSLLSLFLKKRLADMHAKKIRIKAIGDLAPLPAGTRNEIEAAVRQTSENKGMVFIFAINYGGRDEIVRAVQKIQQSAQKIDATSLEQALDTAGMPEPDMIIRTGGEMRTSGFLLWQSQYAEYIFRDELFPDFTPAMLRECIDEFYSRKRRFGK